MMPQPNIAFAGLTAAGKTTHARLLAEQLGYSYVSATEALLGILDIDAPGDQVWFERNEQIQAARTGGGVDDELDRRLALLAATGTATVFDTWALAWVGPGPMVRVWIESDPASRARKCLVSQTRSTLSLDRCAELVREKDADTRARFVARHGFDLFTDRARYDLILVGGVHANFYPQQSLTDFRADVVFRGESEESLREVLDRAAHGSRDFTGITGTWWADTHGLHREAPRPPAADIDRLAMPARHLLPLDDVVIPDRLAGRDLPMAHVMLSRGCPFPCAFCAAGHTRARYRGGPSARAELLHLAKDYGIKGFAIVDDNFVVNRRKVTDICEHIAGLDLTWSALSRVDTVDRPLLDAMAAAGCIEIKYGVESGSESLLKAMRKNTTRTQIKKAFAMTADAGIEAKAFIIHGFPGEDEDTTEETISLLTELGSSLVRVSLFRFAPLPGSGVYADPDRYNLHGLHTQDDWDGDWSKFHIHHNPRHWWGTHEQWQRTEAFYRRLHDVVEARWNPQG
jgi:anaerobic magnesium-protoporphyrin IX monomethyl ester cyclase